MAFPNPDYHQYTYYQGVICSELIATIALFAFLQILHYCIWGHEDERIEKEEEESGEVSKPSEEPSHTKWDQKAWNVYFSIIFGNHIAAVILPLIYLPNIFSTVIAYVHFTGFFSMLINTIFIKEKEPGKGGKTKSNRIFWIIMCMCNIALIVGGLSGISQIIK